MIDNKTQDIQLFNDILNRNYYYYFKQNNNKRRLIYQFFPNNFYNNSSIIPGYNKPIVNEEDIIYNFSLLLDWYNKNNFICDIQIDDEIWLEKKEFRNQIFELLYQKLINKKINLYITNSFNNLQKEDFQYLIKQINLFNNKNINIIYTVLMDSNNFYNKELKEFVNRTLSKIKIKITPESIVNFQEDYLYLIKNFAEKRITFYEEESNQWTEEKIQYFINFIDFYFKYKIDNFKLKELLYNIFQNNEFIFSLSNKGSLDETSPYGKCKLYHNININVFNLGINFCKKFQYDDLTIGYYQIEDNKITNCLPNNLPAAMVPAHSKRYMLPKCEYCHYLHLCNGYCHGDAYKINMNPLTPIYETCKLRQAKFAYILYKLKELKLFNIESMKKLNISEEYINHLTFLYEQINISLEGEKINE